MKKALIVYYGSVLLVMAVVTAWAGSTGDVFQGAAQVWALPWGRATFFDTYFAFATFFLWVAYREKAWGSRALWFLLIMSLGNLAVAAYMLRRLALLEDGASFAEFLTGKKP